MVPTRSLHHQINGCFKLAGRNGIVLESSIVIFAYPIHHAHEGDRILAQALWLTGTFCGAQMMTAVAVVRRIYRDEYYQMMTFYFFHSTNHVRTCRVGHVDYSIVEVLIFPLVVPPAVSLLGTQCDMHNGLFYNEVKLNHP